MTLSEIVVLIIVICGIPIVVAFVRESTFIVPISVLFIGCLVAAILNIKSPDPFFYYIVALVWAFLPVRKDSATPPTKTSVTDISFS